MKKPDKFTKTAERIVDRMDTDNANYYPRTMIKDLAAALRRVAKREKARTWTRRTGTGEPSR